MRFLWGTRIFKSFSQSIWNIQGLVALSGGLDSIILTRLFTCQQWVEVSWLLHVNHKAEEVSLWLGGRELRKLAVAELPVYITSFSRRLSESVLESLLWFLGKSWKKLVTAHHADDELAVASTRFEKSATSWHRNKKKVRSSWWRKEIIDPCCNFIKGDFSPIFHFEVKQTRKILLFSCQRSE